MLVTSWIWIKGGPCFSLRFQKFVRALSTVYDKEVAVDFCYRFDEEQARSCVFLCSARCRSFARHPGNKRQLYGFPIILHHMGKCDALSYANPGIGNPYGYPVCFFEKLGADKCANLGFCVFKYISHKLADGVLDRICLVLGSMQQGHQLFYESGQIIAVPDICQWNETTR